MDRMAQTALNSLKMIMENQASTSHNLANINTPGFKQDIAIDFSSLFLNRQEGIEPRILSSRNTGGFSIEQGQMETTQNPMDLAFKNEGYFIIQPKNGGIALSRRGDLQTSETGELLDGAGNKILDNGLAPIVLPAFTDINFSPEGQIRIKALGDAPEAPPQNVALIGTYQPDEGVKLKKSLDGHIRIEEIDADGNSVEGEIVPNQLSELLTGFLEKSNVNAVEEMVNTLDQQRKFEMHIKMIQLAEELDEAGASLMRSPGM